jgi:hypothetical protein
MNLATELIDAGRYACAELRSRISEVRCAGDGIEFRFNGTPMKGTLRGRNRDLCLGFGAEQDKSIALRVMLDGDAEVKQ